MTNLKEQLRQLGFTPNQSLVYLSLFKTGEAKAGALIKQTGLHRNLVYVALQELIERKLVVVSQLRGVAVYKALSASRLLGDVQEKERVAKQVIEELALFAGKSSKQEIVVYEGIDEFRRHVLHTFSTVKSGGMIRYLGISPRWYDIVGYSLAEDIFAIQQEKKVKMRALAQRIDLKDREFAKKAKGLVEAKISPLIAGDTSGIEILDNRISIRSFIEPYFVVEITHPQLAKNYQNHFDFLWKLKTKNSQ